MKTRKGIYKIAKNTGWQEEEGSVGYDYPFMVHKKKGGRWKVSHMATGRGITGSLPNLNKAKEIATSLKPYTIFLMPDLETWEMARTRMMNNQPKEYAKLLKIIKGE